MTVTRRAFLSASAAAALTTGNHTLARSPNERIRIALIGAGSRGGQLLKQFSAIPSIEIASVCDADRERAAEQAKNLVQPTTNRAVKTEVDLRHVLDDQSIDAVVIATPNHWHALATIWACEAGKHVYVEKPLGHSLWESQQMVKAATKYKRIVQCGTHRRSFPHLQQIMSRVHGGEFGRVIRARVISNRFREAIGRRTTPLPIPKEIDYNLWAGPAPLSPLYRDNFHYDWHWMWSTGNGDLGNIGSHMLDLARWGLNEAQLAPAVMTLGGRFTWDDAGETPNTLVAYFDYKSAPLIMELRNLPIEPGKRQACSFMGVGHGFVLECEHATIAGANHLEIRDRQGKVVEELSGRESQLHPANFVHAMKQDSQELLTCPLTVGHVSCGLALQANISYQLGTAGQENPTIAMNNSNTSAPIERMLTHLDAMGVPSAASQLNVGPRLEFAPESERFVGDLATAANEHLKRPAYRGPFVVREVS